MIVNRADTTKAVVTLQEWIEKEFNIPFDFSESTSDFAKRGGIVHRLDKETSGAIIIAKNEKSFIHLQKQFKEGGVTKTYLALVHGSVNPPTGEIKLPIGRLPWNRMRFGVFPQGRDSRTLYKVREYKTLEHEKKKETVSLVEVYPKTGRTHQIRVHFQYLHHPLFGDELYAGRKTGAADRLLLPRHFLHASSISFIHPGTNNRVEFNAPLSPELAEFLKTLK